MQDGIGIYQTFKNDLFLNILKRNHCTVGRPSKLLHIYIGGGKHVI